MLTNNTSTWLCSCGILNDSDKETTTCIKCHILESKNNLKRARELYILGNISRESVELIPLKEAFFIYNLSVPNVTYTKHIQPENGISVDFSITIADERGIEKYHIEQVKFDVYDNNIANIPESFVLHSLTPYHPIFSRLFDKRKYNGSYKIDIYVKCYGSNEISPKRTIDIDLSHSLSSTFNACTLSSTNYYIEQQQTTNVINSINNYNYNNDDNNYNNDDNKYNNENAYIGMNSNQFILTSDLDIDDIVFVEQKEFGNMTVKELKEECRKYGFYVTGTKLDLQWRLRNPLKYIDQRKRYYHKRKFGSTKRFLRRNYIWKNGNVIFLKN